MENGNLPPAVPVSTREKNLVWSRAIHTWKMTGRIPEFLVVEMGSLRDRDGDPLSDEVLEFFFDLLLNANRAPIRKRESDIERAVIRSEYRWKLQLARYADPAERKPGESPADLVIAELADKYRKSISVIDQIVRIRPSRQPRKPRKT